MRIWPRYDGSVRASVYPVMFVLKTSSPKIDRRPPKKAPRTAVPSSRTRAPSIRETLKPISNQLMRVCIEAVRHDAPVSLIPHLERGDYDERKRDRAADDDQADACQERVGAQTGGAPRVFVPFPSQVLGL